MPQSCAIPNCKKEAHHNFGVRLRRPDTSAIWAPNTEAFLCDEHASMGLRITVILEPTNTRSIETTVVGISQTNVERTTPISKAP
jgi:hypothetical protein